MSAAPEEAFVRYVTTKGLLPRSEVEEALGLKAEMSKAGLEITVAEVLVLQGRLDDEAGRGSWKAATGAALRPRPVPPSAGRGIDDEAIARASERGSLTPDDLDGIRVFQSWAAARGIRFGLAELIVRSGYLASEDLLDRPAPAPKPAPPRKGSTDRLARPSTKKGTRRMAAPSATPKERRGRKGPSAGVIAGIALGAAVPIVLAVVALVALRPDEKEDPSPHASGGRPDAAAEVEAKVAALGRRVEEHLREGRFDDARSEIESLRESISSVPDRGRHESALRSLEERVDAAEHEAGERPPEDDRAARLRSMGEEATKLRGARRVEDAIRIVDAMIELDPENFAHYLLRAQMKVDLSDCVGVREDCGRALVLAESARAQPAQVIEILNLRAQACEVLLELDQAKSDLERSIELDAEGGLPIYLLARVHRLAGQPDLAIEILPRIKGKRFPRDQIAVALVERGLDLLDRGDRDGALSYFSNLASQLAQPLERRLLASCRAWAWVHPGLEPTDVREARRILDAEAPFGNEPNWQHYFLVHGAVAWLEGDAFRACSMLDQVGGRWQQLPETTFYFAEAARAVGLPDRGRQLYDLGARIRPAIAARRPW